MNTRTIPAIILLALLLFLQPQRLKAEEDADKSAPVIVAIDEAIKSLREKPNQFHLDVYATGVNVTQYGGSGTGINVEVHGGGMGSQTTGMNVTMDTAKIDIVTKTIADRALREQAEKAVQILNDIKTALTQPEPDRDTILSKLSDLGGTFISDAVKAIIDKLVRARLGL
jgi:hypothetical protein